MNRTATWALIAGAVVLGASAAYAAAAPQSAADAQQTQQIPKGWSYDIQHGQRVAKGNRVTNPDGSWREEITQGKCVTVKEKSADGEYKETRQCNH